MRGNIMERKLLITGAVILLLSVNIIRLYAADVPVPSSNMNTTNAGKTDIDYFSNVTDFNNTTYAKQFFFFGYGDADKPFEIGYGRKFDTVSLGLWFNGNVLQNNNAKLTETADPTFTDVNGAWVETARTTTKGYSVNPRIATNNVASVFIGINTMYMGFNVGISESLETSTKGGPSGTFSTITKNQTQTINDEYSDYSSFYGTIKPFIQWGKVFRSGRWTFKTYIDAMFNIASWDNPTLEYTRNQRTTSVVDGSVSQDITTSYKANYMVFAPDIKASFWFNWTESYGFRVGYELYKPFYGNEFGLKTTATNPVAGTKEVVEDFITRLEHNHYIPLDFWYYKGLTTKLKFGLGINALLGFTSRDDKINYTKTTSNTSGIETITGKSGATDYKSFGFDIWPQAKIHMQYTALGGLLYLNGGLVVTLPHFGYLRETRNPVSVITKNASGTFEDHPSGRASPSNSISANFEGLTSIMNIGFTLALWPMVLIDAVVNCPTYALDLSSVSLIITVKD